MLYMRYMLDDDTKLSEFWFSNNVRLSKLVYHLWVSCIYIYIYNFEVMVLHIYVSEMHCI